MKTPDRNSRNTEYILLEALVNEQRAFREETRATLKQHGADIQALKQRASVWGGIAGILTAVGTGFIQYFVGKA